MKRGPAYGLAVCGSRGGTHVSEQTDTAWVINWTVSKYIQRHAGENVFGVQLGDVLMNESSR